MPLNGSRAIPIYVVGDSTALIHRDRIYASPRSGAAYITRALYCPGLQGSTFSDAAGVPHPDILNCLRTERLVVDEDDGSISAFHRTRAIVWRTAALIEGRVRAQPILTFSVGGLDVPPLARDVGADVDFEISDGCAVLPPVDGALRRIPTEFVLERCRTYLEPFERGLQTLRRWGFEMLSVHSIPPVQAEPEALYQWLFAQHVPVRLRTKLAAAVNMVLREICERNAIVYLDDWPIIASGGVMRSEYAHDAFHYNGLGARHVSEAVVNALERDTALGELVAAT